MAEIGTYGSGRGLVKGEKDYERLERDRWEEKAKGCPAQILNVWPGVSLCEIRTVYDFRGNLVHAKCTFDGCIPRYFE